MPMPHSNALVTRRIYRAACRQPNACCNTTHSQELRLCLCRIRMRLLQGAYTERRADNRMRVVTPRIHRSCGRDARKLELKRAWEETGL